jgi:hypothetical protein
VAAAITLSDLRIEAAYNLGYGRSYPTVSKNASHVDSVISRGMRWFYFPNTVPGVRSHRWSFMAPEASIVAWADVSGTIDSVSSTQIIATESVFYGTAVGRTILMADGTTEYTITATNGTQTTAGTTATVAEDPTGETGTFTVASGTYRLPSDFNGNMSQLTYRSATGYPAITMRTAEQIRDMRNEITGAGHPVTSAVVPAAHDGSAAQKWDLLLHPEPDADYTLDYQYFVEPNTLISGTNEYPHGGTQFGEAILSAVQAACELERYHEHRGLWEHFVGALVTAIDNDIATTGAKTLGRNTGGDSESFLPGYRSCGRHTVIYNGVEY